MSEKIMFRISDKAKLQLKDIMEREGWVDFGLRISAKGGGCSALAYTVGFQETAMENDKILEVNDIKIYVDPYSVSRLQDIELDFLDGMGKTGFIFRNRSSACNGGCGNFQ